jgi:cell wall-associated NlpC family hydrolase
MKLFACTLPLLAGLPSVMSAQVSLSLPKIQRPAVRATLGPVSLVATLGGHGVSIRAGTNSARRAPVARAPRRTETASVSAARILSTADSYVGKKYVYGGDTPGEGFDCSGFVQYVFGRHGVDLPRTSRQQAGAGRALSRNVASLKPGDLMFFASKGGRVDHVAIYAGNNRMMHSSAGAGGVVYDDLSTPRGKWYLARHVASRRVL